MNYDHNKQNSYDSLKGSPMDVKSHSVDNVQHPHGNHGKLSDVGSHPVQRGPIHSPMYG